MKLLVVEDEYGIREFLRLGLEGLGKVQAFENAVLALKYEEDHMDVDIVIMDVMMPEMDGFEAAEKFRTLYPEVGIILLTAKGQLEDKLKGLAKGADDYLVKPFALKELIARIEALYRKVNVIKQNKKLFDSERIPFSGGILNTTNNCLEYDEHTVKLTSTETQILEILLRFKDRVISRDEFLNAIWGVNFMGSGKIVDVNVQRLRRKLGKNTIVTVWGEGYKWVPEKEAL
jgi:DNA-binding response OmpR family regulator